MRIESPTTRVGPPHGCNSKLWFDPFSLLTSQVLAETDRSMKTKLSTRRAFLKQTTGLAFSAAALPSIIPASALGKGGGVAPSNRIAVGCIGVGPQGQGDMSNFLNEKGAQVVAVCDVKTEQLEQARAAVNRQYQNNDCATHSDFREVVARKHIDALLI